MNVKECYEMFGGDYDEILHLLASDERILKYLLKFKEDQCMDGLTLALKEKRYEDAFRYVHTLKGVSSNLRMKKLEVSSSDLTEVLRRHETEVDDLYEKVKQDYEMTIQAIDSLMKL